MWMWNMWSPLYIGTTVPVPHPRRVPHVEPHPVPHPPDHLLGDRSATTKTSRSRRGDWPRAERSEGLTQGPARCATPAQRVTPSTTCRAPRRSPGAWSAAPSTGATSRGRCPSWRPPPTAPGGCRHRAGAGDAHSAGISLGRTTARAAGAAPGPAAAAMCTSMHRLGGAIRGRRPRRDPALRECLSVRGSAAGAGGPQAPAARCALTSWRRGRRLVPMSRADAERRAMRHRGDLRDVLPRPRA